MDQGLRGRRPGARARGGDDPAGGRRRAVLALSIKTAASLLEMIELRTWEQLAAFTAILALRVVLKRPFAGESARSHRAVAPAATAVTSSRPPP